MKNRAFKHYLARLPKQDAMAHVYQCLRDPSGTMAWELMAESHGDDWKCPRGMLFIWIGNAVDLAAKQVADETAGKAKQAKPESEDI